jgi:nitrite reductase/ring-hydroxylating ferredoxin subunit
VKYRVASTVEVPEGTGLLVEVKGKCLAVFRYQGRYYTIDDTCPHKGGSLHEGPMEGGVVSCPWHHWSFDLRSGESPVNPLSKVGTYRTWDEGGDLFVEI